MSNYTAQVPRSLPSSIKDFYTKFYQTSDSPTEESHNIYVSSFTPDATLIMGTRVARGHEGILDLRKANWSGPVKTRKHTIERIYTFGNDGDDNTSDGDGRKEIMMFGNVLYGLKNGKDVTVEWAGRASLVGQGEDVKMAFYQVYLDSAPVANALKD